MKMKKLFAGLVATSMVAAMGTSAMAAVNSYALNPTVSEAGVVALSVEDVAKLDDYAETQMTVLIIPEAAYNKLTDDNDETNITDDDIYYIDQMAANDKELFQKMGLKCGADLIPEGATSATYYVRVGGAYDISDGIYQGTFTVTKAADDTNDVTIVWGDVTADGAVSVLDASAILNRNIGGETTFADENGNSFVIGDAYDAIIWGDVTADGAVSVLDASAVLNRNIGGETTFTDDKDNSYTIGDEYTINYPVE